ncbi:hypothetical protein [Sutterella seckii]|uniref:Uncharacterized protein n=1 Tax=Sutterella seckii TaxID=1944635 RepID=A0A6I1EW03_9BURK|nr:hypothetical protein [Sutterella seckii]KAB7662984.1 hypothetical protein GBM95_01430 [Sutterella seckii]MBS5217871.1 hypothetical protein [Sutterella wadsworthensis]
MPTYDVILPEGHVILRDRATGAELRLSAANGPLCLGSANFSFSLDLKPFDGKERREPEAPAQNSGVLPEGVHDEIAEALERFRRPAPGSGPETELPFLSPAENLVPEKSGGKDAGPALRVLDAPLESLTEREFEKTLESLVRARDDAAREAEFLEEIEADPEDVAELRAHKQALDERFARVSKRFDAWRKLQKRLDEERGINESP